jgi:hypothetical protein
MCTGWQFSDRDTRLTLTHNTCLIQPPHETIEPLPDSGHHGHDGLR